MDDVISHSRRIHMAGESRSSEVEVYLLQNVTKLWENRKSQSLEFHVNRYLTATGNGCIGDRNSDQQGL